LAGSHVPHIFAIGRVPREDVLERLSQSTLIFPSLIETYGLPLAEARALGSIVLAADLPYAREVLEGYNNAYFFDPYSPNELAALMREVMLGKISRSPAKSSPDTATTRIPAWANVLDVLTTATGVGSPNQ